MPTHSTGATPGSDSQVSGAPTRISCDPNLPGGTTPLRRLTHLEYNNSVRDLVGLDERLAENFAPDTRATIFDNSVDAQSVSVLLAEQYLDAAQKTAETVDVTALAQCGDMPDADCARAFAERFARRAYRRPLTQDKLARLISVYDATRAVTDHTTGLRALVASVLASPLFLFRVELGGATELNNGAVRLNAFEVAARMASLLWASVPDETLLDAAERGQLVSASGIEQHARRMVQDAKARDAVMAFYDQLLGLAQLEQTTKDTQVYPSYTPSLRASMLEETRRFVSHVLWEDDGRLSTLLTANYSFVDQSLAALYGAALPKDAGAFARVTLPESERSGVLTHASILSAFARADQSSPVKRGDFVRQRLLCQEVAPPPADVPELAPIDVSVSNRERYAMHTSSPACAGCHALLDGIGFGLEAYDGIGRYRLKDGDQEVDANGELTFTEDANGPFTGGPALAQRLAASTQVRDCIALQWFRYASGRLESSEDACALADVRGSFARSGGDLRELLIALTQTDAFRNYQAPQ